MAETSDVEKKKVAWKSKTSAYEKRINKRNKLLFGTFLVNSSKVIFFKIGILNEPDWNLKFSWSKWCSALGADC